MHKVFAVALFGLVATLTAGAAQSQKTAHSRVWRWSEDCGNDANLVIELSLDGQRLHSASVPVCLVSTRSTTGPQLIQKPIVFYFTSGHAFRGEIRTGGTRTIECMIWQARAGPNALVLRISFAHDNRVLLSATHKAEADTISGTGIDPGIIVETYLVKAYTAAEAYRVYDAVLPGEQAYPKLANGTLVIQEATHSSLRGRDEPAASAASYSGCLTKKAALEFKEALEDFARLNETQWLLQRRFTVHDPYVLVGSPADFRSFPGAAGDISLSPVGFNRSKTKAVVFVSSSCGGLCGSERLHLLERIDGKWKEVQGVTCQSAS